MYLEEEAPDDWHHVLIIPHIAKLMKSDMLSQKLILMSVFL